MRRVLGSNRSLVTLIAAVAALAVGAAGLAPYPAAAAKRKGSSGWPSFAPFVGETDYPAPDLKSIRAGSGARALALGFVTAKGGTGCAPTWGGYSAYPATGTNAYQRAEIRAFQSAGGTTVPSFGGEDGAELATVCSSTSALKAAYAGVIAAYGATRLDFDIEGSDVANFAAARRRATVLAELQRAAARHGRSLGISLTLPALPSGLTADSLTVVRDTVKAGVKVITVNGMAMDYGDSAAPDPSGRMGTYAIDVARHMKTQLASVFRHRTATELDGLIGITPMIGINDDSDEVFTLADAKQLTAYARKAHLGTLSMWDAERDRQCPAPVTSAQYDCSGVSQSTWAFARILRR